MRKGSTVICPACNGTFIHPGRKRRWCSDECANAMRTAAIVCASRLKSVERSMDQVCKYCDKPLGPMDIIGRKSLPGRRSVHPECKKRDSYRLVGDCECGRTLRKRDGGICAICRKRNQRDDAREAPPVQCSASYESFDTGEIVRCQEDAYPTMEHCSKHRGDMRRHGEFLDWKWRWDDVDEFSISQKNVAVWRDRFLKEQGGRCGMFELCGKDESNNDTWHLDHDHSCEHHVTQRMCQRCVRGTLCWFCNVSVLGALEKDGMSPLMAARAVMRYLESGDQLKLAV